MQKMFHSRLMPTLFSIVLISVLSIPVLFIPGSLPIVGAETNPPDPGEGVTHVHSGDWEIEEGDTVYRGNQTIIITGDIWVRPGATFTLYNSAIRFDGNYGLYIQHDADVVIRDSELSAQGSNRFKFEIGDQNEPGARVTIDTTAITKLHQNGLKILKSPEVAITGSSIATGDYYGVQCDESNVTISGTTFNGFEIGLYIQRCGPSITDCEFTGNRVGGAYTDRDATATFTDCTFENNDVVQNSAAFVAKGGSIATLTACTFNANQYGAVADNGGILLDGCTVTNNIVFGVLVDSGTATIRGCSVTDNEGRGVYADGGSITMSNNTITGNADDGLSIYSATLDSTDDTVRENGDNGIAFVGSTVNVTRGTILANQKYNCYLNGTTITLRQTNLSGIEGVRVSEAGFLIQHGSHCTLIDSTLVDTEYGIYCQDSALMLDDVTITNTAVRGLRTTASTVTATGLNLHHNDRVGLEASSDSTINFDGCTVSDQDEQGILMFNSSFHATDSVVRANTLGGIYAEGSQLELTRSRVETNSEFGVWPLGGTHLVAERSVFDNNEIAVAVDAGTARLMNSTCTGSSSVNLYLKSGSNVTVVNTTYEDSNNVAVGATLTVQWYLHVRVQDQLGAPLDGVGVQVVDHDGTMVVNETTVAGSSSYLPLTQLVLEGSQPTEYTPHTLTVRTIPSSPSDGLVETQTLTMDTNRNPVIVFNNTRPSAPAFTAPVNRTVLSDLNTELHWSAGNETFPGDQIMNYTLEYGTDPAFETGVNSVPGLTDRSYSIGIKDNSYYYCRVRAVDGYGLPSAWSTVLQFGVDLQNEAPEPPVLLGPADDEYYSKAVIEFQWAAAEDVDPYDTIDEYRIQYSSDATFGAGTTTETVRGTSYNIQVSSNQIIYWRVMATDAGGLSSSYQSPFRVIIDLSSEPPSEPPTIDDLPELYIGKNREYQFDLTPYVSDDGGIENLFVVTNRPSVIVEGMMLTFNESEEQIFDLNITVSDGFKDNQRSRLIHVTVQTNRPPEIRQSFQPLNVSEGENITNAWNMNDHFIDYDETGQLSYFATPIVKGNVIRVSIDEGTGQASLILDEAWYGTALIKFRAVDSKNAFKEQTITLTVDPVNDHPEVLGLIRDRSVNEGGTWEVDLRTYFSDEEDIKNLTFTCNKPAVQIVEGHLARWKPSGTGALEDVVFTATDSEGAQSSTEPITITVVAASALNTFMLILIIIFAASGGAVGVIVYKYLAGKFEIEEIFLVDRAGLLVAHASKKEDSAIDEDLVGSMLTAVLDFVKDSFRSDVKGEQSLGKLQYGDATIIIERGDMLVLASVIAGTENPRLRTRMKAVLESIEKKYWYVLRDWDGDIDQLSGVQDTISKLMK